ncbi:MAG: GNAT family N-acetyltransferase [Oscillospiraceae bacterium]|nr:GNAT family N-acetyltransferase [Oscillospiraceae bacterium]
MQIIGLREHPEYLDKAIHFIFSKWGNVNNYLCYHDCIEHSINIENPLPRWYLLEDNGEIIGCAGLLINDFISRMDLFPWLSSLYVDEGRRGNSLGSLLINHIKEDAKKAGFSTLYLGTEHIGYFEKFGFQHIGTGYHPWGDSSRIYKIEL